MYVCVYVRIYVCIYPEPVSTHCAACIEMSCCSPNKYADTMSIHMYLSNETKEKLQEKSHLVPFPHLLCAQLQAETDIALCPWRRMWWWSSSEVLPVSSVLQGLLTPVEDHRSNTSSSIVDREPLLKAEDELCQQHWRARNLTIQNSLLF